jgi:hypothetical protein
MYRIEVIWPLVPLGALTLLIIPWVGAMLAVVAVLIVAVAMLVALVGAIVALPFLLARSVHRHWRSGRALPAHTAQATVNKASLLTSAGRPAAAPQSSAALLR